MNFDQDNLKMQLDSLDKKLDIQNTKLLNLQNQMTLINKEISGLTQMKETLTKRLKEPDIITVQCTEQMNEEEDIITTTAPTERKRGRPKKIVV
jgi:chromosome segregation ATPase